MNCPEGLNVSMTERVDTINQSKSIDTMHLIARRIEQYRPQRSLCLRCMIPTWECVDKFATGARLGLRPCAARNRDLGLKVALRSFDAATAGRIIGLWRWQIRSFLIARVFLRATAFRRFFCFPKCTAAGRVQNENR